MLGTSEHILPEQHMVTFLQIGPGHMDNTLNIISEVPNRAEEGVTMRVVCRWLSLQTVDNGG
jgi:hypothetical protein